MYLILHNPSSTGSIKVKAPDNVHDWTLIGVALDDDEIATMTGERIGSYVVIDLAKGAIKDTFAVAPARRTIS